MLSPITIRYDFRPARRSLATGQVADLFGLAGTRAAAHDRGESRTRYSPRRSRALHRPERVGEVVAVAGRGGATRRGRCGCARTARVPLIDALPGNSGRATRRARGLRPLRSAIAAAHARGVVGRATLSVPVGTGLASRERQRLEEATPVADAPGCRTRSFDLPATSSPRRSTAHWRRWSRSTCGSSSREPVSACSPRPRTRTSSKTSTRPAGALRRWAGSRPSGGAGKDDRSLSLTICWLSDGTQADWPHFARWHYRGHDLAFVAPRDSAVARPRADRHLRLRGTGRVAVAADAVLRSARTRAHRVRSRGNERATLAVAARGAAPDVSRSGDRGRVRAARVRAVPGGLDRNALGDGTRQPVLRAARASRGSASIGRSKRKRRARGVRAVRRKRAAS